ncbi:MAG: PKD domain-containing protein [Chitinophagales bacterium]|nr:PKD domain-containing protein [Chitinophagales bacterium]
MKKELLLSVLILTNFLLITNCIAQSGEWTWMKGDIIPNSPGVFGTLGVPDPNNTPPALYGPAMWINSSDNIYLFGGVTYNTLWKYDVAGNTWTWINGSTFNSASGVYGTMGIPSSLNTPGARGYGFLSWKDLNGDFWIYGGVGYDESGNSGILADLWKYTVATNEWTWMNGSNSVFSGTATDYGTFQVPSATNTPGSREETTVNWVDSEGNLWFYGGFDASLNLKSDVWKYDIILNQWVWMAGSSDNFELPVYGTMGVPSASNTPGGRNAYGSWKDLAGDLWIFGGCINGNQTTDLWRFDLSTFEWTWMNGSTVLNPGGVTGAQCASDTSFYPMSRCENRAAFTDQCGNFWMFGGVALQPAFLYYSDLWVYRPSFDDWTFTSGSLNSNQNSIYGTQGVSSPLNMPGGRYGTPGVFDSAGNIWLFGGNGSTGILNDLWKFVPDTTCPAISCLPLPSPINFTASDTQVCEKFCVSFTDSSSNNPTSWQWTFDGASPASSNLQNPVSICYDEPGVYDVTLVTTNASGTDSVTFNDYITVNSTPPAPTITLVGITLTSSPASSYQWQFNSVDIAGATSQSYTATQTGLYNVVITDSNGCVSSAGVNVTITAINEVEGSDYVSIYPNPSNGNFVIDLLNAQINDEITIIVMDVFGRIVFSYQENAIAKDWKTEIDLIEIATGVYVIEVKLKDSYVRKKIVVSR